MHALDGSGAWQPSLLHHAQVALGAAEYSSSVHAWWHVGHATRWAVVDSPDGALGGTFEGLISNVHLRNASSTTSGQRPAEGAFHGRQRHWTDLLLSTLKSIHPRGRIYGLAWVGVGGMAVAHALHGGLLCVSGVSFWNQATVAVILCHKMRKPPGAGWVPLAWNAWIGSLGRPPFGWRIESLCWPAAVALGPCQFGNRHPGSCHFGKPPPWPPPLW